MLPLYPFPFPRKVLLIASISLASAFVLGISLYQVDAQVLAKSLTSAAPHSSANKVYLGAPAVIASPKKVPMLEMHVANNGLALLRGATVIANSRGTLRVGITWGSADFTWKIETDSGTKFITPAGEKQNIEDIAVGDIVTVTGTLKSGGNEPVIEADYVRE